jgi:Transposase DDE domain
MTSVNVARRSVAGNLSDILESDEVCRLIDELQQTRWTGRPGYPLRAMIGMALAKSLYAIPTWTRTVALVAEHPALAAVIAPNGETPSVYVCYRFTAKLREHAHLLEGCIARVVKELKRRNPVLGWDVAIDASDMPAYANGQRFASKGGRERSDDEFSDPDASWGHRSAVSTRKGGGFYGYRLHMAVDTATDLPLAWQVETARSHETNAVAPLLDKLHGLGIDPETAALDKGYDNNAVYAACGARDRSGDPAPRDTGGQARRPQAASLLPRAAPVRRGRLQARSYEVALPRGSMHAEVRVGEGRPAAPADPS